jgi:hypothetical protein
VGLFSQSASRTGPYDPTLDYSLGSGDPLDGWVRLDFDVKPDGRINMVLFESGPSRTVAIGHLDGLGGVHTWHHARVEWEQTESQIRFVINGYPMTVGISSGRNPIGNLIFVGNMDRNVMDRCVRAGQSPCGTVAPIRYRNWRWGH